jgi:hypothetical protein
MGAVRVDFHRHPRAPALHRVLIGTARDCATIGTHCKLALTAVTPQHLTGLIGPPPDELIELVDQLRTEAHQNWRRSWR